MRSSPTPRLSLHPRRSNWREVVLVCRKCSKRQGGGFGPKGDQKLGKALRKALGSGKGRSGAVGFVEVGCLGLCPKDAVTVVRGSRPGEMFAAPVGAAAEGVAEALGLAALRDEAAA